MVLEYIKKALSLIETQKEFVCRMIEAEHSTRNCRLQKQTVAKKLKWTDGLVEFVELLYALHRLGCFNKGKITLTSLFGTLGSIFDFEVKNFSRTFTDIKNRSKGECTVFIDSMKEAILQKIKDDDEKYMKRTRKPKKNDGMK